MAGGIYITEKILEEIELLIGKENVEVKEV